MENEVTYFCGTYPEGFEKVLIENDSNFIFNPDPSFEPKTLFDSEKNNVTVNSFLECEHYVTGGWNFNPVKEQEIFLQDTISLSFFILGIIVFYFFGIKKVLKK